MIQAGDFQSAETLATLSQMYRYSQVGRCVSSVTHDVNNLLGAVMAYAELVQMDAQLSSDSRRMLGEVMEATRRCSDLVNNLTSVSRKERPDVTLIEPATLLAHVLDLRRYDIRVNRIVLMEDFGVNLPSLVVDRPKLEQALIYLINNAMEAIGDTGERVIRVKLEGADGRVNVVVWNSGPPIPESEWEAIFAPFYTTREEGHLGLGLHIAREYTRLHEGELRYDPSHGFVMELPHSNNLSKRLQETPK